MLFSGDRSADCDRVTTHLKYADPQASQQRDELVEVALEELCAFQLVGP
jgi:hypothetical protein